MKEDLLERLKLITPEEKEILSGKPEIEQQLYMSADQGIVDAKKLLDDGRLIQVRTHTRFIHFPKHTHNYIEVVYMCCGSTHHVINGEDIILEQGELLFLNQKATQEIYEAGDSDIAVNFIILPEFFDYGLKMIESEENMLRDFIIDCLRSENESSGYLLFRVAEVLPIQNLIENLIWTVINRQPNIRSINQATMGLLFLQLMNHMDKLETDKSSGQQKMMITVLSYVEEHYRDGELRDLAKQVHYNLSWLSKEIKKQMGMTYTELVQIKRLSQAAYLLSTTSMSVIDVAMAVGYDNISFFHRIFHKKYRMTPRQYRISGSMGRDMEER